MRDWRTDNRELIERNLEFRGACPSCNSNWTIAYFESGWKLECCGAIHPNPPVPSEDDRLAYEAFLRDIEEEWEEFQPRLEEAKAPRAGHGDWGTYEVFQLPVGHPDRNAVNSLSEMKSVYKKHGINPDTHRFDDPKGYRGT